MIYTWHEAFVLSIYMHETAFSLEVMCGSGSDRKYFFVAVKHIGIFLSLISRLLLASQTVYWT